MFISNGCCSKLLQTTGLKTTETVSQLEVRSPKSRHQQSHISSEVSRRGSFPVSAQASAGGPWCVWACRHISLIFQCLSSRGILHCVFTTSSFCTCFHIFLFFFFKMFVFVCFRLHLGFLAVLRGLLTGGGFSCFGAQAQ